MPIQDQAAAKQVTVVTAGQVVVYERGELLPPPSNEEEANTRSLLRLGGALRVVEVVYTPDELRARERQSGLTGAQASQAAGIPAAVAPAPETDPRQPVAPVVLGPKPPSHGTKRDWVAYATGHGMGPAEAEGMTRDELSAHYRDEPG
jgi:hypothetical protein